MEWQAVICILGLRETLSDFRVLPNTETLFRVLFNIRCINDLDPHIFLHCSQCLFVFPFFRLSWASALGQCWTQRLTLMRYVFLQLFYASTTGNAAIGCLSTPCRAVLWKFLLSQVTCTNICFWKTEKVFFSYTLKFWAPRISWLGTFGCVEIFCRP